MVLKCVAKYLWLWLWYAGSTEFHQHRIKESTLRLEGNLYLILANDCGEQLEESGDHSLLVDGWHLGRRRRQSLGCGKCLCCGHMCYVVSSAWANWIIAPCASSFCSTNPKTCFWRFSDNKFFSGEMRAFSGHFAPRLAIFVPLNQICLTNEGLFSTGKLLYMVTSANSPNPLRVQQTRYSGHRSSGDAHLCTSDEHRSWIAKIIVCQRRLLFTLHSINASSPFGIVCSVYM